MKIKVQLIGGLELLTEGQRSKFELEVSAGTLVNKVAALVAQECLVRSPELFVDLQTGILKEGIVFLVNDAELEFLEREALEAGDSVTFISMIHGG